MIEQTSDLRVERKMGGEIEMLREKITNLEEENDNLAIEKEIALTKMEQACRICVPSIF